MKFTSDPQIAKGKVLHIVFPTLLLALVLLAAIPPASSRVVDLATGITSGSMQGVVIARVGEH
jgi:hypothetical protein